MKEYTRVQLRYPDDTGAFYIDEIEKIDLAALMDGCPVGDGYILTKIEMTETAFKALPEFTGF